MRKNAAILIAFFLAFASAALVPAQAQRSSIKATADSVNLIMGDVTNVTLRVIKDRHEGDFFGLPEKEQDFDGSGIEIVGFKADSTMMADGRIELVCSLKVQAFYPAELITLPPFRYVVADSDTIFSQRISFKVFPVELPPELGSIEQPDSLTIHPAAGPVQLPSKWYDFIPEWWIWPVLGLLAIALGFVLFLLFRKGKAALQAQRRPIPPYELAVQRLNDLRDKRLLDKGQVKNYYTELIDIFRSYLEGRFGINAMEMPSKMILKKIRENREIHLSAAQMEQVLQLADFVKFAAAIPGPEDGQRTFLSISSFVESTKPAPQPQEEGAQNNTQTNH